MEHHRNPRVLCRLKEPLGPRKPQLLEEFRFHESPRLEGDVVGEKEKVDPLLDPHLRELNVVVDAYIHEGFHELPVFVDLQEKCIELAEEKITGLKECTETEVDPDSGPLSGFYIVPDNVPAGLQVGFPIGADRLFQALPILDPSVGNDVDIPFIIAILKRRPQRLYSHCIHADLVADLHKIGGIHGRGHSDGVRSSP